MAEGGQSDVGDNNIQVFVRIKPPGPEEPEHSQVVEAGPDNRQVFLKQEKNQRVFTFDYIADIDAKQETIFDKLGKKVIDNCIAGYNGTIFAYGQTGSGKTYTMMGPSEDADNFQHEQRGVIPRSFEYLYNLIAREKELHGHGKLFLCKCTFLEIYNEQIFDLLEPSSKCLQLRESLKTGVHVSGLSEKVVADASEAYEVLSSSWTNRKVASTSMNRESSRSHAVFTLLIESKDGLDNIKTSYLNLVDLAGSERQKDTGSTGLRLREAGSINKSLSNLGNVIMALVSMGKDDKKRFVPYRDSKLTLLLKDALGGNAKTSLIACVHFGYKCFAETLSTLLFAKRAKLIKNKAVLNENSMGNVKQLQAKVKLLKEELSQYKAGIIPNQPSIVSDENMPVLREMFLQAMMLRQNAESEKQDLYTVIEQMQEIIEKKDKAIQTNKMIIKFRDNNIKRLEGKTGLQETDTEKGDLLKEIGALRTQVDHHPLVTKLSMEIQKQKATIRSLREDSGVVANVHKDKERTKMLDEKYQQLMTSNEDENHMTPQRPDVSSTQTIEKLRSQISDLESQKEKLSDEMFETKKSTEKTFSLKDGEIDSLKKYVAELEMVISANNMRSKLEKDAMNEMHRQTVLTITTPKKESYKLRSRTVVTSSNTPDLDSTIPFESEASPETVPEEVEQEEGILGEIQPEEVAQQAQEAFLDQIKQLQEKNASVEIRLAEYEMERVKQMHQQTVLESQLKSLEELLEKEKQVVAHLREQQSQVEPKLKAAKEEMENAVGETRDLRLLLTQADKQLKEYKEKLKAMELEKTTCIEKVELKCGEVAMALEQIEKENEKLLEEKENLEFLLEAETGVRQFQEDRAEKLEMKTSELDEIISELGQHLQIAEKAILDEKDLRETMVTQLSCEGKEKEQEWMRKCEENQQLEMEYAALKNMLEVHEASAATLRKAIEEKDAKFLTLEKNVILMEEKVRQYYDKSEEQSEVIADLRQKLESAEEMITFYKEKEEVSTAAIEQIKADVKTKDAEHASEKLRLTANIEVLEEDLKANYDLCVGIQKEFDDCAVQLKKEEAEKDKLREEVNSLKETLKTKEEAQEKLSSTSLELDNLTEKLDLLESARMERILENEQLKTRLKEVNQENQSVTSRCETLKLENETSAEKLECQRCEIARLLTRCNTAEARTTFVEADRNQAQYRLKELEDSLEELVNENEELKQTEKRLKIIVDKDSEKMNTQQTELEKYKKEGDYIRTKLREMAKWFTVLEEEDFQYEDLVQSVQNMAQENKKLVAENTALVGHSNHRQKIKYLENLKHENCSLKMENESLRIRKRHVEEELKRVRRVLHVTDTTQKENIVPEHKSFLSGDYSPSSSQYTSSTDLYKTVLKENLESRQQQSPDKGDT